jgi:hypothetical protein
MSLRFLGTSVAPGSPPSRTALRWVIVVLGAFGLWLAAYFAGLAPWLGYAWLSRSSFGIGPIGIIGENRSGTDIGFDDFLFFEGQEIVIDYEVDVRAGSLWFHVFQPFDGKLGGGTTHYVTESGAGTWTMPVRETAIYHITIEGSPTRGPGRGWDLDYKVWWGARWAE